MVHGSWLEDAWWPVGWFMFHGSWLMARRYLYVSLAAKPFSMLTRWVILNNIDDDADDDGDN